MHKSILLGVAAASSAFAAQNTCQPASPAPCNQDSCSPCFCLGPDDVIANSPVYPRTCDGDVAITVAGLYWKAEQEGMEYAVENNVSFFLINPGHKSLIDAEYKTPHFRGDTGYKVGIAYHSPCDGWDVGVLATYFRGKASSHDEAEIETSRMNSEGRVLISLWSAFNGRMSSSNAVPPMASDIKTNWHANLHLIDIDLGREYWVSKYLSFRSHIGIRGVLINQDFTIYYSGGSWGPDFTGQPALNDEVDFDNDFKGVGIRSGFDANWHFGCGWSLYSELSASIIYGRFNIDHDEMVRIAESPFSKQKVLETKDHFRASRAIADLALGLQYATLVCDCKYGWTIRLAWEQHLFFHQNQLWRVVRAGEGLVATSFPNDGGENIHHQRRGTLGTQGCTLSFKFDF